ncbi:MAG: hypothetical protein KGI70_02935 [Patescibacteria group bacterium]|nr:hypothetical protein [Patescibacteria group bacterium]
MEKIKKFALNALLTAAAVLAALLIAEFALRALGYGILLPHESMPDGYYTANAQEGYDIAPNFATSTHGFVDGPYQIWSNNLGCFDEPYAGQQPYIYITGDSFAWGFAPFAQKWGTLLEQDLGIRTVKCGVAGFGTKQELAKATRLLAQLPVPTTVVLSYFENDDEDDANFPNSLVYHGQLIKNLSGTTTPYNALMARLPQFAQWAQEYCMWNEPAHPALQRVKCFLRNNSALYVLAQNGIKSLIPTALLKKLGIVNEDAPMVASSAQSDTAHLENLLGFKILAKQKGAKLFVAFIPPKEFAIATSGDPYAGVKKFLDQNGIAYFDPMSQFRTALAQGAQLYWTHDLHFNSAGNALFARAIEDYLQSHP